MTATNAAPMHGANSIREFLTAGRATFTVVSRKSGERRTFRATLAKHPKPEGPFFLALLRGPDNENDYAYLGCLWNTPQGLSFKPQENGKFPEAKKLAAWVVAQVSAGTIETQAEFWHAGRCGRCGRQLTDPESIKRGIGPVCDGMESGALAA